MPSDATYRTSIWLTSNDGLSGNDQGMGVVRPVMIALVLANILNVFVNWSPIFGRLGAPAMGVRGRRGRPCAPEW